MTRAIFKLRGGRMLVQIKDNVWKLNHNSNMYVIKVNSEIIVIDSCPEDYGKEIKNEFKNICNPKEVNKVLFTHLHYDHIGNFEMFENATYYASKAEVDFFKKDKFGAVLRKKLADKFGKRLCSLEDIEKDLNNFGFKIFSTPGHTIGSVVFLFDDILFSGDTYFGGTIYGRTDLPSSVPDKMPQSLKTLKTIQHKILCPGHDYL
jgi:glyoxylase-like metal-dependent hydrolase (beta-lactamase superfamily II)